MTEPTPGETFAQYMQHGNTDTPAATEADTDTPRTPRPDPTQGGHGYAPSPGPGATFEELLLGLTRATGRGGWTDIRDYH